MSVRRVETTLNTHAAICRALSQIVAMCIVQDRSSEIYTPRSRGGGGGRHGIRGGGGGGGGGTEFGGGGGGWGCI